MATKVTLKSLAEIQGMAGVDTNGDVQRFATDRIIYYSSFYVPYRSGSLVQSAKNDGNSIEYSALSDEGYDYAEIMHRGYRMDTGKPFNYNEAPNRGADWEVRAYANHKYSIIKDVQNYIDRR